MKRKQVIFIGISHLTATQIVQELEDCMPDFSFEIVYRREGAVKIVCNTVLSPEILRFTQDQAHFFWSKSLCP